MAGIHPGMPGMPMMFLPPMANFQQHAAGTPNYSQVQGFRQGMDKKLTTGGISISKLPKIRLSESVEFVEPHLDSTLLAQCDQDLLAMIVWLLTRIRPNIKIQDLRCDVYVEIYIRFKNAAARLKQQDPKAYNDMVVKLVECGCHAETHSLESVVKVRWEEYVLAEGVFYE